MIGTQPKLFSEIVDAIGVQQRLLVMGCGGCAKVCHTGGEPEVEEMVRQLQAEGHVVLASGVPERTCYIQHVRAFFDERREQLEQCDCVVILGCGGAVQTVRQATEEYGMAKPVVSALKMVSRS